MSNFTKDEIVIGDMETKMIAQEYHHTLKHILM